MQAHLPDVDTTLDAGPNSDLHDLVPLVHATHTLQVAQRVPDMKHGEVAV